MWTCKCLHGVLACCSAYILVQFMCVHVCSCNTFTGGSHVASILHGLTFICRCSEKLLTTCRMSLFYSARIPLWRLECTLEHSSVFQSVPLFSITFQSLPVHSRMIIAFQSVQCSPIAHSSTLQHAPVSSSEFQWVPFCSNEFQWVPACSRQFHCVPVNSYILTGTICS